MARPMPEDEPVTIAVLPVSELIEAWGPELMFASCDDWNFWEVKLMNSKLFEADWFKLSSH